MSEIVMPRLSDTMEEGTILRWLKADGEQVERGEELVEIETDKATMVYESDQAGTLRIIAAEGDTLAVGHTIATVGEDGAGPAPAPASASAPAATPNSVAPPPAGALAPAAEAAADGGRVKASPLARRMAHEGGIDLSSLSGTGPGGRIVKADVLAGAPAAAAAPAQSEPAVAPPPAAAQAPAAPEAVATAPAAPEAVATAKGTTTEVELTRLQQAVARRMAEAKATIPEFTLQIDVDMDGCVALRRELKELGSQSSPGEATPTYNDMIVKACALALREHPAANGSYRDGRAQLHGRVNVGVAVAVPPAEGSPMGALVVPTVFDADTKSLGEIARETRLLAGRVRDATITPPELGGGTFTVSNLGMYGIRSFTAIINPPQAAILSVGVLEPRPVVADAASENPLVRFEVRSMMTLTLACDHRILFGAEAARFLARVRELLQSPAALSL